MFKEITIIIIGVFFLTENTENKAVSNACIKAFRAAILSAQNTYRSQHQVGSLNQSETIGATAQAYASYLAADKLFEHSGANLGENIGTIAATSAPTLADCSGYGTGFAKMWYDAVRNYDYKNPGFNTNSGSFSQIVWKASNQLGCGIDIDSVQTVYAVCNYFPAGNSEAWFAMNVFPAANKSTNLTTTKPDLATIKPTDPPNDCLSTFRAAMLNAHNTYRSRHQVGPLQQNTSVGVIAQKYASYLAANKVFEHSGSNGLGENLGKGGASSAPTAAQCANYAQQFAKLWYDEVAMYSFKNPESTYEAGHFTQVVWKGSNQLGCGIDIDSDYEVYIVCNYYPQGNYMGSFAKNVFPVQAKPTDAAKPTDSAMDCLSAYRAAILNIHNTYRSRHQVGPLQQNASIGAIAQRYASYLARNKIFMHSDDNNGLGENLGKGGPYRSPSVADCASYGQQYAKAWYDEVSDYNFRYPESNSGSGHFTQMVWKNTNQLGCGIDFDSDIQVYIVCNYYPSGNWGGENSRNVFPKS